MRYSAIVVICLLSLGFVVPANAGEESGMEAPEVAKDEKGAPRGKNLVLPGSEKVRWRSTGTRDLYAFVFKPADWKPTDRRPAVLFFHGGGFTGGSPASFAEQCRYFAERGMVAITAEYRIRSIDGANPADCMMDGRSCVRWVRGRAAELGIDAKRLVVGGGSAGGKIAATCAFDTETNLPDDDLTVSCVPDALLMLCPLTSFSVKGGGPPTLVLVGEKDHIASPEKCNKFAAKMQAVGNKCEVKVFTGGEHGFFNKDEFRLPTLKAAEAFLTELGFLPVAASGQR